MCMTHYFTAYVHQVFSQVLTIGYHVQIVLRHSHGLDSVQSLCKHILQVES